MIEEAFDIYAVLNFTERFYKEGYVASYNVPVDQHIYDKLNYSACKNQVIQTVSTTTMTNEQCYSANIIP